MRVLGIFSLASVLLSLSFWFLSWFYFTFLFSSFAFNSPVRYVAQGCTTLGILTEYLAIGLLSVGLIVASKRFIKS